MMIDHADPNPEALKQKLLEQTDLAKVIVIRLRVQGMSGKYAS